MHRDPDLGKWLLAGVIVVLTLAAVGAFLWYLDSVGTADGPGEGRAPDRGPPLSHAVDA